MALMERLGFKTLDELWSTYDNNDIMTWVAYDKLQDTDWIKKVREEQSLERQKNMTLEEEAEAIRRMFMNLQKK